MPKPRLESNRGKVAAQLSHEGWVMRRGSDHDVYKHPNKPGRIVLPRHRTLSPALPARLLRWPDG
jgi:predicted RNA binding protein YcfA (HicA-like mRNA interferase family)